MSNSKWGATVQSLSTTNLALKPQQNEVSGCLVRIHPLELESNLFRLSQARTMIGREPTSDIFCDDTSISRNHACIIKSSQGFLLEDCQSTNGTFVDGQRIEQHLLTNGCQFQIGNHIFKYMQGDSIETQYHETVYSMMTKDGLTGAYNKRYLIDALSREFERSQHYGRPITLVMMDIDFFKKFNDTYGHLAGDEVLQEFARRIQAKCGANQIFARFGGEEFALLLIETERDQAADLSEAMRLEICSAPFQCCAGDLSVTASFGVGQYDPKSHLSFSDLIELADQQLYKAKANGRNQVCAS